MVIHLYLVINIRISLYYVTFHLLIINAFGISELELMFFCCIIQSWSKASLYSLKYWTSVYVQDIPFPFALSLRWNCSTSLFTQRSQLKTITIITSLIFIVKSTNTFIRYVKKNFAMFINLLEPIKIHCWYQKLCWIWP